MTLIDELRTQIKGLNETNQNLRLVNENLQANVTTLNQERATQRSISVQNQIKNPLK